MQVEEISLRIDLSHFPVFYISLIVIAIIFSQNRQLHAKPISDITLAQFEKNSELYKPFFLANEIKDKYMLSVPKKQGFACRMLYE